MAIVVISWITLWLEGESPFGSMIDIILAIIFVYNAYSASVPRVSYIKAMSPSSPSRVDSPSKRELR